MVEHIAFNQSVGVLADVEGVTSVVEPVVVVGVPVAVEFELWGAAGGVVNVVTSEGYVVALPIAEAVKWWLAYTCIDAHIDLRITLTSNDDHRRRRTS